jgi:diacylglycerol kinase
MKSVKKLFFNLKNSISGLREAQKEHSFLLELIFGILLIPFLIISEIETIFKLLIASTYFFLLSLELINTAIEKISDIINKDFDLEIKKIKDLSSAAVFIIFLFLIILIIMSVS